MNDTWRAYDAESLAVSEALNDLQTLLARRNDLTSRAQAVESRVERLRQQLALAEAEAEQAWEEAVDLNQAIRKMRLHLHRIGVDERQLDALIEQYRTPTLNS